MTCPYLEYREGDASRSFDAPRAFCTVVDEFVQPMRADVCNDRYSLEHATDCEFYLAAERDGEGGPDDQAVERGDRPTESDDGAARDG